ncbi:MAG: NUDIX hydrolase [Candidatus Paceibacterota bacterium]|jgi:8-oxo-dGTP pyrophosphatase MutT (NUDIX family)
MEAYEALPEFGIKREKEERRDGGCAIVFDPERGLYGVGKRTSGGQVLLFGGGVSADEDIEEGVLREVREESGLYDFAYTENIGAVETHYHNIAKNVDRVARATCFLVVLKSTALVPTELEEHEQFTLVWMPAAEIRSWWTSHNEGENYSHWIYFMDKALARLAALGYDTAGQSE